MPLITVKDNTPVIPAGTYKATLIGIVPKDLVTKYTKDPSKPDAFLEWAWDIKGTEIRSLTTVASGPKSRINEYLVALLGADRVKVGAGFDESDLVGKTIMAQVVIDEDGWSKIDRVMAAPQEPAAPVAAARATTVHQSAANANPVAEAPVTGEEGPNVLAETEDDLPF